MSEKKLEFSDNLGDIDSLLHNQGVSDLSWLSVDESDYRASETLPKQNLDIIPELQKALTIEESNNIPQLTLLRPHNIVNVNPVDSHQASDVDITIPIRNRVAKLAISGHSLHEINDKLALEFSPVDIEIASAEINKVSSEYGLLGNVYIDANHFPNCASDRSNDRKFVATNAKKSLYVLGKPECRGCVRNMNGRCASFQKTIVDEVPYGPKLAAHYASSLLAENRVASLSLDSLSWKDRLQAAFNTPISISNPDGVKTFHTTKSPSKVVVSSSDIKNYLNSPKSVKVIISSDYKKYSRRMMDGKNDVDYLTNSGKPELMKLASEYGLLGHTWVDMDVLGGCRKTVEYLKTSNIQPDFILRRNASCDICKNLSDGGCAQLCKSHKVVSNIPSYDKNIFKAALSRCARRQVISSDNVSKAINKAPENSDWRSLTAQANTLVTKHTENQYTGPKYKIFAGSNASTVEVHQDEVRRFVSHLMNTGLSGSSLQTAILSRYSKDDLTKFPELGRRFASEERIQGKYYIDPTAYSDYGSGCSEGSSIFKYRGPKNVLASDKCTGCTMQLSYGHCSKYCKPLIRSVPKSVRAASKLSLPVIHGPIENPVEKYELNSSISVDLNGVKSNMDDIDIDMFSFDE